MLELTSPKARPNMSPVKLKGASLVILTLVRIKEIPSLIYRFLVEEIDNKILSSRVLNIAYLEEGCDLK